MYYDLFDPKDGQTQLCVRFEIVAKFLSWLYGLDYNYAGCGYMDGREYETQDYIP
jgi:hypothetical protein